MAIQEGQTLKDISDSEWYSMWKIDFIQVDEILPSKSGKPQIVIKE